MADCLSFVTNDSTITKPEGTCCSGLKSVLKTAPSCLREASKSIAQFGVVLNVSKALTITISTVISPHRCCPRYLPLSFLHHHPHRICHLRLPPSPSQPYIFLNKHNIPTTASITLHLFSTHQKNESPSFNQPSTHSGPFISLQTTLILSLILPFHALLHRLTSSHAASSSSSIDEAEPTSLYEGTVYHQRRHPVHHSFQYNVRYALIDLDRAPHAPPNHLSPDEARQITGTHGPILLLTIPPSVGYEQNPLSVYYCYDVEESATCLKKCIAEVTNTPWAARDDGKTLVTALWVDHSADIGSPYPR